MKYTVLLLEGRTPKRCIGVFDTQAEAEAWAIADGWDRLMFKVLEIYL